VNDRLTFGNGAKGSSAPIDPTLGGHVDDRVVGPDDIVASGELTVEYAMVALRFVAISVDGVVGPHGLSREGPEACSEEEKP